MKLVADIDSIMSNLNSLSKNVEEYQSAINNFKGASIDCSLEEVKSDLESYKNSILEDLNKLKTSSEDYEVLVDDCCTEYQANEEKVQSIDIDKLVDVISNNTDVTIDYKGDAASKLTGLPSTEIQSPLLLPFSLNGQSYMALKFNGQDITDIFGSQLDSGGSAGYGYDSSGCDDYARGYCIYLQTGKIPSKASVSVSDYNHGLSSKQISAGSRKEQVQLAYDLLQEGKPSVIHLNSPSTGSGRGHWVTVVGCRKGTTRDSVKIDDLIILDPVTGTVRSTTEDKEYLRTDTGRCSCDPGFHINFYA